MRKSDYPNVHRRWVAVMVMVILLLSSLLVSVSVCQSADVDLGYTSGIWVYADDSPSGIGTNEIRWGGSTGYGQSGYRFDNAPDQSFDFDDPFLVGTLWHFNWPIYPPSITEADLNVTLNFTDPLLSPDPSFTIRFNHDETTNYYDCSRCEYTPCVEPGCPDKVTFPSAYPEEYFRIGDKLYTLKILGFVDSWPGGTLVEDFVTQEYKDNHAFLIGTLSSVLIPEPQINIIKETSDDNTTWYDANNPPGPYILVGNTVYWRYIVQNTGNVPMTDITVTDDNGTSGNSADDFVVCSGFALDPGNLTYCYATGTAVAGQYGNIGTVTGYYSSSPYSDTDPSHYFGCSPACDITAPDAVCELSAGNIASTTAGYVSYTWVLSSGTITAGQGTNTITWTAPSQTASPVNISVTVVDSNGCTNTCYKDVLVYELPACDITAPDAVCELSAGNIASTTAGYVSYTWVLSSGTITAGQGTNTITWTAPSQTASPVNISVTVVDSNGCTNTCYKDVLVYELPACDITAPDAVCELSAGNSASTTAGYVSYTWVLSSGTITAGQGTNTITWTAPSQTASPVNISVTVVDSNGCTNTCYKDVLVYELPACDITAPDAVCELSAGNSASTTAGYVSYTWVLSSGTITAGQGTNTITWTAPSQTASPVNISVTVVDSNGCTNTCYKDVLVYELPACDITAPDAVCELSAGNSASTTAGYVSYTWVLSSGTITAGQGTNTITWTAPSQTASPVNISVTVVDSNGCTNTCYKDVLVYELPACDITAPDAVCELSAGNIASTTAGYVSYTWVLSSGTITAGQGTNTITWTAPSQTASPVNISVTVVDSNGCTNTCYKDVLVYELPACDITAPDAVCELSAGNIASTTAGYVSYTWVLSSGTITAGQGTNTITWTAPSQTASPVNISVTVVDSNGCTNTCYKDVLVYELPACDITAPDAVCELSAGNIASTTAGYVSYTWVLSSGTITAGQGTNTITWTAPSQTASPVNISVTVVDSNGCTNTCYKDVLVYELPACDITAPDAVCELSAGNIASTTAGYVSYTWVLSSGTITAGQGTNTITWTAPSQTASPVNISVTVVDSNGCTNTCYKDVLVYELPACDITAPDAVCELSAGNIASTTAGYVSYTWVLSSGTITAGQGTNTITWTAPSQTASPVNISVTVVDSNGCTNTCYKDVLVYELPACDITAPDAVCELSAGNIASTTAGYVSYTWVLSSGTITAGQGTNTITWTAPSQTASPVNISVTVVDSNGCTNTCYKDVLVYELPACDITAPDAVCELSAGNIASTTAGYVSYTWVLSSGTITAGQGTNTITWTAPSQTASPVNISVTVVDSNGCTNTCYKDVLVYELPACDITAPDAVCELSAGNIASTTAGYVSYTWVLSSGTITAGQGTNTITWTAPSQTASPVNISVTVVDSNGCTNTCYKDVLVYELPACDITAPDAVCELSAGNSASTTAGYVSYTWVLSSGTITAGQGTNTITWTAPSQTASPVNISVTVVDSNGCTNTCYKDVLVYELPACDITAPDAVCELSAGNSASTTAGYVSYTWVLSSGTITAGQGTNTITWTAPSQTASPVNISVTVVDSNGCTNTCYKDVLVYELPACDITAPDAVCELSAGNSASTTAGYVSYTWVLSSGTITAGQGTNTITWTAPSQTASPVNISVTVVDSNGCTNTCYKDVKVYAFKPSINIIKTASLTGTCPGSDPLAVNISDTVTYCFNVTNTGDVNLTSITVIDNIYGPVTLLNTTLAPGESTEGTVTHVVVESDAPSVTNTANVTGTDPLGGTVTDTDNCTINVAIAPGIEVVKTASVNGTCPGSDPLNVSIGDTVTYCYNVTNTGDVTLTGVTVNDDLYGPVTLLNTTLAPGESTEGTVTHVVVESDAPSVTNIATATGTDPLGGTVNDTDDCTIIVKIPEVELEKSGSPAIVAPGGDVTYTINYTNTGAVPLHNVVITEHYPKGVTFISASPAPDAGTNNVWTIGTLLPGESGTIVINVKVPEQIDLSFTETGSVIGEGVVMVTKDLSTEQRPYSLRNRVTLSCAELAPVSRYATTKVSGVPGTSLGITESGSGVYSSDEILDLETKNKSIILDKSTHAEYKPTSFNFSDSFSVNFTNKWKQDICSRNMEIDAAIHKKISDATYIDDETISRVDKDKSIMNFDSSFNGSMYIGARTKDTEISETYIGEFDVLQTIQIAKGPIPTPAPTPTPTPIWLPCPYNDSQGNTTEDAEPTP